MSSSASISSSIGSSSTVQNQSGQNERYQNNWTNPTDQDLRISTVSKTIFPTIGSLGQPDLDEETLNIELPPDFEIFSSEELPWNDFSGTQQASSSSSSSTSHFSQSNGFLENHNLTNGSESSSRRGKRKNHSENEFNQDNTTKKGRLSDLDPLEWLENNPSVGDEWSGGFLRVPSEEVSSNNNRQPDMQNNSTSNASEKDSTSQQSQGEDASPSLESLLESFYTSKQEKAKHLTIDDPGRILGKAIAGRIAGFRKNYKKDTGKEITQKDLARQWGISKNTLNQYINKKVGNWITLEAIIAGLGIGKKGHSELEQRQSEESLRIELWGKTSTLSPQELGVKIQGLKLKRGWTNDQLAQLLDCNKTQIEVLESGLALFLDKGIPSQGLRVLAQLLEIKQTELMFLS